MEDIAGCEILAQAVRQGFQKTPFKVRLPWHPCSPFALPLTCCVGCGPVLGAEAALFCGTKMEASGEIQGPPAMRPFKLPGYQEEDLSNQASIEEVLVVVIKVSLIHN